MRSARRMVLGGRRRSAGGRVTFSAEAQRAALAHAARVRELGFTLQWAARELGARRETLRRWQRELPRPLLHAVQVATAVELHGLVVVLPSAAARASATME